MSAWRLVATIVSRVCGFMDHAHGHCVDQHLIPGHIWEIVSHFGGDLIPHHHGMTLRVALGHDGKQLARSRLGQLKGVNG